MSAGSVTVSFPSNAFPDGATPQITLESGRGDSFLKKFRLPGTPTVVANVQAASQPSQPVQVSFAVDLAALPIAATPAIFYREPSTGLWLPIPTTVDQSTGRIIGTSTHFTDFVAALTTVVDKVEGVVQWFRYQVADALGARGEAPSCSGEPAWVTVAEAPPALNDPLPACIQAAPNGDAELHLMVNRGYSLSLNSRVRPKSIEYEAGVDTARALYQAIARQFGTGRQDVFLPAHVETVLTYARGSLPEGAVTLRAQPSALSMAADPIVALLDAFGSTKLSGHVPQLLNALNCVQAHLDYVTGPQVGSLVAEVASCLDSVLDALTGVNGDAAAKILTSVKVVLLAAKATQNTVDELMALNEDAAVRLKVLGAVSEPPVGSLLLSDVLLNSGGAGPSGTVVDPAASISGKLATHSTSQWVGCEGTAAWGEYALNGRTRLTGWLGFRDFAEAGLAVDVRVLIDTQLVTTLQVSLAGTKVDLKLPRGQRLRLEAQLTRGSCGPHSEGYMAWGNGALSAASQTQSGTSSPPPSVAAGSCTTYIAKVEAIVGEQMEDESYSPPHCSFSPTAVKAAGDPAYLNVNVDFLEQSPANWRAKRVALGGSSVCQEQRIIDRPDLGIGAFEESCHNPSDPTGLGFLIQTATICIQYGAGSWLLHVQLNKGRAVTRTAALDLAHRLFAAVRPA